MAERSGSQTVSANMALGRLSLGPKNARNEAGDTSPIRPPNTHSKRGKALAPGDYEYYSGSWSIIRNWRPSIRSFVS